MDQGAQKKIDYMQPAVQAYSFGLESSHFFVCNHHFDFEAEEDFKRLESAINRVDIIKN